jgi:hypothetical protein
MVPDLEDDPVTVKELVCALFPNVSLRVKEKFTPEALVVCPTGKAAGAPVP